MIAILYTLIFHKTIFRTGGGGARITPTRRLFTEFRVVYGFVQVKTEKRFFGATRSTAVASWRTWLRNFGVARADQPNTARPKHATRYICDNTRKTCIIHPAVPRLGESGGAHGANTEAFLDTGGPVLMCLFDTSKYKTIITLSGPS